MAASCTMTPLMSDSFDQLFAVELDLGSCNGRNAMNPSSHSNAILDSTVFPRLAATLRLSSSDLSCGSLVLDHTHDVGLFHDDQLFAVELDLGARPFAEQHAVA